MKEFLIGAAGIVIAGAAIAQAPVATPAPPAAPHAMPPMADRIHSRDDMVAKVREHFAQLDENKDGFLTKAEAESGRQAIKERVRERLGERREMRMDRRNPAEAFDRLDANKDGAISREEFGKGHEMRIERRTARRVDAPDGAMPHKGMRMHRFGSMMGGHMFDMADANRDGRVTPEERRQMHRQMMEKHRAPKAS